MVPKKLGTVPLNRLPLMSRYVNRVSLVRHAACSGPVYLFAASPSRLSKSTEQQRELVTRTFSADFEVLHAVGAACLSCALKPYRREVTFASSQPSSSDVTESATAFAENDSVSNAVSVERIEAGICDWNGLESKYTSRRAPS